jgi:hypothetical protein
MAVKYNKITVITDVTTQLLLAVITMMISPQSINAENDENRLRIVDCGFNLLSLFIVLRIKWCPIRWRQYDHQIRETETRNLQCSKLMPTDI